MYAYEHVRRWVMLEDWQDGKMNQFDQRFIQSLLASYLTEPCSRSWFRMKGISRLFERP